MPIGADAVPELMVTAEQREFMYHQIRKFRDSKPIFTLDFWNDGEYVEAVSYTHLTIVCSIRDFSLHPTPWLRR